jgi:hypothetical protein
LYLKVFHFNFQGLARNQISCVFSSATNTSDCSQDLHWFYSFEYGNCFQFNMGLNAANNKTPLKYALDEGEKYGLTLSIFPLTNSLLTLNKNGMIVYVHDNSFEPTISDSVKIRTGEWSYISIKKEFSSKQPEPYSNCVDLSKYSKSNLYSFIQNKGGTYRQKDCFNLCIQEKIIDHCKCYYLAYRSLNNDTKPCLSLVDNECLNKEIQRFNDEECAKNSCPLECDVTTYDVAVSSLVNPSIYAYENLNRNEIEYFQSLTNSNRTLSYEMYKSLFVNVTIFYKSLLSTEIIEIPKMSIADVLSQMGGSLQLFVSYSIFTFFELAEIILLVLFAFFFKKKPASSES